MDKEKILRSKKSISLNKRRSSLPPPPETISLSSSPTTVEPQSSSSSSYQPAATTTTRTNQSGTTSTSSTTTTSGKYQPKLTNELKYLIGYKEREKKFLKLLKENCTEKQQQQQQQQEQQKQKQMKKQQEEEEESERVKMMEKHENIKINENAKTTTKFVCQNVKEKEKDENLDLENENEDDENTNNNNNNKCDDVVQQSYETECENYVMPLLNRTNLSISASLATQDSINQLDKLHSLLSQLLTLQEQNYKMRRNVRNLETIYGLKKIQKEISTNHETYASDQYKDDVDDDLEFLEFTRNEKLLETIIATGQLASKKRNNSKRQRSKSVFGDDIQFFNEKGKEMKHYPLCRQSAVTDIKAKVSKWTKVKAAFKWERANVTPLSQIILSTDSGIGLAPVNNEIAKYLRVPSIPCQTGSGDSIFSSSSGHILSSVQTPGTSSNASSIDDIYSLTEVNNRSNRYSVKSESQSQSDDFGRSRSLDGEVILVPIMEKAKNKTPWRKVKDILQTHRGSFKVKKRTRSVKSAGSGSPCDSIDALSNSEMFENYEHQPITKSISATIKQQAAPSLKLTTPSAFETGSCPNSPLTIGSPNIETGGRSLRSKKLICDIEILPENAALDLKKKPPPSPLTIRQDSSDAEILDPSISPLAARGVAGGGSKWSKVKKAFLAGSSSGPNSPIHHTEFFGDSEDLSSGDFSEPSSPNKLEKSAYQNNEIKKRFYELQRKLNHEFEIKQLNFERMRAQSTTSVPFQKDVDPSRLITKPVLEDDLSPDFKKKLHEWRIKKQQSLSSIKEYQPNYACQRLADNKKIDWQLWKTGQFKLEGQGLSQLPDEKDLSEDFQKKLGEWKRIKANTRNPSSSNNDFHYKQSKPVNRNKTDSHYTKKSEVEKEWHKFEREQQRRLREKNKIEEREKAERLSKLKRAVPDPPGKEVVVQTSEGVLKFEGISRKFTRKLYEWEKSRGIGPESSTFALLHPGYRPIAVAVVQRDTKNRDIQSGLTRSMSVNSLSQSQSIQSISHQPSSLSLNDADDIKADNNSTNDRRVSSNPEFEISNTEVQSDEPEAVIVEVEDDIEETAAPLITTSPSVSHQMPVYKYEKSCNQICSAPKTLLRQQQSLENKESLKILRDTTAFLEKCELDYLDINALNSHLELILDVLPYLPKNIKRNFPSSFELIIDVIDEMKDIFINLEENKSKLDKKDEKFSRLYKKIYILRNLINNLCSDCEMFNEMQIDTKYCQNNNEDDDDDDKIPQINITTNSTKKLRNDINCDQIDNKAYVTITPTLRNKVTVSQVQILDDSKIDINNDLIPTTTSVNQHIVRRQSSRDSIKSTERLSARDSHHSQLPVCPDNKQTDNLPSRTQINEQDIKKITKTINNGTKRKTKIRRLGSRQNSKTESDSSDDETQHIILETPRKCKRKTSRAKKIYDSEKLEDSPQQQQQQQQQDDVVYILKIKPNKKIENNNNTNEDQQQQQQDQPSQLHHDLNATIQTNNILISPIETCSNIENIQSSTTTTTNIFVKTKRKIFSSIDMENGTTSVIAKDLESSSASDKNDNEKLEKNINVNNNNSSNGSGNGNVSGNGNGEDDPVFSGNNNNKIIRNLPPLPQSPSTQRRLEQLQLQQQKVIATKELSPSIRMMIAKYNQRLTADKISNSSPLSSGNNSPIAWRSPVLERRGVRAQTEKYQEKVESEIIKSSSVESIRKINKIEKSNSCSENFNKTVKPLKGVLKSYSAGRLETDWKTKIQPIEILKTKTDNFCSEKATDKKDIKVDIDVSNKCDENIKKERIYKKLSINKNLSSKYNAMKKNVTIRHKSDPLYKHSIVSAEIFDDLPDKSDNLLPKITRKYDSIPTKTRRNLKEIKIDKLEFELTKRSSSTPNSPNSPDNETKISLNDRALKLKLAKEEFLNKSNSAGEIIKKPEMNQLDVNRLSQISTGSGSSIDDLTLLTKSSSVGMIGTQSNDNQHIGGYVSLPRNIRPSGTATVKLSRFGLTNIAQKLRKVKLRRNSSKDINKMNTISTLCRQSLMVDITGETKNAQNIIMECSSSTSNNSNHNVNEKRLPSTTKSSSGTTFNFNIRFRRNEQREKLRKSKSVGTIEEQNYDEKLNQ